MSSCQTGSLHFAEKRLLLRPVKLNIENIDFTNSFIMIVYDYCQRADLTSESFQISKLHRRASLHMSMTAVKVKLSKLSKLLIL